MDRPFPFPHQRLNAWRVALELVTQVKTLCERIPRGYRNVADHMLRAAVNTALLLAEGANRLTAGQKRQRFGEARGEVGEVAGGAQVAAALGLVPTAEAERVQHTAGRVAAMLTRLIAVQR